MENYLNEKLKLTNYLNNDAYILLNSDDDASKKFMERHKLFKTFGLNGNYKILNYEILPDHTNLEFSYNNTTYQVTTN